MRLLIVERCVETVQACAPPILCTHRSHTHTHTHTPTQTHTPCAAVRWQTAQPCTSRTSPTRPTSSRRSSRQSTATWCCRPCSRPSAARRCVCVCGMARPMQSSHRGREKGLPRCSAPPRAERDRVSAMQRVSTQNTHTDCKTAKARSPLLPARLTLRPHTSPVPRAGHDGKEPRVAARPPR